MTRNTQSQSLLEICVAIHSPPLSYFTAVYFPFLGTLVRCETQGLGARIHHLEETE